MSTLLQKAAEQAQKRPITSLSEIETSAYVESSRTGRPVTWHRPTVKDSAGRGNISPMRADAGTYRAGALMALATKAARSAARRFPLADLEELTMELVEAALQRAPSEERLPRVGEIGTDPRIERPLERDRAYLIGIARHRLADQARSEAAEVDSLEARLTDLGDLPTVSGLLEQAHAQAHTDPNLGDAPWQHRTGQRIDPDAHPINGDAWQIVERFPTKDAGRAALSNLVGSAATRAQLAKQAGLGEPKDWHRSVKRGRAQLASLTQPVTRWTAKDWGMAEGIAALVAALGPDHPRVGIEQILHQPPPIYRAPSLDRPWRVKPDTESPCVTVQGPQSKGDMGKGKD